MTISERTVGSLQEDEAFSLDGGKTWHTVAVNSADVLGYVAIAYFGSRRDTVRLPVDSVDQPCLVDDALRCGDCGRTVHLHQGTTTGYRHAPVTKAKPEWEQPCIAKPPSHVLNVANQRMP
jgi:hypothetical protein